MEIGKRSQLPSKAVFRNSSAGCAFWPATGSRLLANPRTAVTEFRSARLSEDASAPDCLVGNQHLEGEIANVEN
jgi:hypothetical protein